MQEHYVYDKYIVLKIGKLVQGLDILKLKKYNIFTGRALVEYFLFY